MEVASWLKMVICGLFGPEKQAETGAFQALWFVDGALTASFVNPT
jgi:hypothetical protein